MERKKKVRVVRVAPLVDGHTETVPSPTPLVGNVPPVVSSMGLPRDGDGGVVSYISPLTPPTNTPAPVVHNDQQVVMESNSPSLFTRINTPSDHGEEREMQEEEKTDDKGKSEEDEDEEEEEDEGGDDEQGDVSVSPLQLADEMQKGRNKVIASEIKKLDDVDECAEILSLLTLHFRYLKKEICGCGVRLTIKYKELGTCAKCSGPKNPVKKIFCMNCKLVALTGKFKEGGYCATCILHINKRQDAKMGAKCGKKK